MAWRFATLAEFTSANQENYLKYYSTHSRNQTAGHILTEAENVFSSYLFGEYYDWRGDLTAYEYSRTPFLNEALTRLSPGHRLIRLDDFQYRSNDPAVVAARAVVGSAQLYEISPGVWSHFPATTIAMFHSPIELSGTLAKVGRPQSAGLFTNMRGYERRRRIGRIFEVALSKNFNITIGAGGSISFFAKTLESKTEFRTQAGNRKIDVLGLTDIRSRNLSIVNTTCKASQIAAGSRLFLYSVDAQLLNIETMEFESIKLLCLGVFASFASLAPSPNFQYYFEQLANTLHSDPASLFSWQEQQLRRRERLRHALKYSDRLLPYLEQGPEGLINFDASLEESVDETQLTKLFNSFKVQSALAATDEWRIKEKIQLRFREAEQATNRCSDQIQALDRALEAKRLTERQYTEYIADIKNRIAAETAELERLSLQKMQALASLDPLADQLTTAQDNLNDCLIRLIDESQEEQSSVWVENLKNNGIQIQEISYTVDHRIVSGLADPAVGINQNASLVKIRFLTTRPVVIKVDPDTRQNCLIVGGPYSVVVSYNTGSGSVAINIKPAQIASVIGVHQVGNGLDLFWHPHTNRIAAAPNAESVSYFMKETWQSGCLGNIYQSLYGAFQAKDPKLVIFCTMQWIQHANSSDAWGANWKYFPRLDQVSLDGTFCSKLLGATTEETPINDVIEDWTEAEEPEEDFEEDLEEEPVEDNVEQGDITNDHIGDTRVLTLANATTATWTINDIVVGTAPAQALTPRTDNAYTPYNR